MRAALLSLAVASAAVLIGAGSGLAAAPAAPTALPIALPTALPLRHRDPCPNPRRVPDELKVPTVLPPGEPPEVQALEIRMLTYLYGDDPQNVPSKKNPRDLYPYRRLGWCVDKYVRDTGSYYNQTYYGTHPAVRIYYSPEIMSWLRGGRVGMPADGAVIIKEQYPPPAARYRGTPPPNPSQVAGGDDDVALQPHDWTIMIRNSKASHDGWFWAELYTKVVPPASPTNGPMSFGGPYYPNASYGLYCVRCHSSADNAMTFASLRNVKGYPGDPILYYVDNSWRTPPPNVVVGTAGQPQAVPAQLLPAHLTVALDSQHPKNLRMPKPTPAPETVTQTFPPEPYDQMLARPTNAPRAHFVTSDQCMSCHSAASGAIAGPTMWLTPPPAWKPTMAPAPPGTPAPLPPPPYGSNVSPYGEWRWSPMGLAGRDPVFFSQLEGEMAFIDSIPRGSLAGHPATTRATLKSQVTDLCMRCHGVMGKRTNEAEHPGSHFNTDWVFASWPSPAPAADVAHTVTERQQQQFHYGGLARDGISCTVCHQIRQTKAEDASLALVLNKKNTGLFDAERQFTQIHGPFENDTIAAHPMNESLGIKPVFSQLTTSSRLCASCHSIDLPVVDHPNVMNEIGVMNKIGPISGTMPLPEPHDVEQNTYVEWVNSEFQTEYKPGPRARSCQACHMPSTSPQTDRLTLRGGLPIRTAIAITQDQTYPEADNLAPIKDITTTFRDKGFRRHELLGLNAFLLTTFQQNPVPLGVRLGDYMSGSSNDLGDAVTNVLTQARDRTATVRVTKNVELNTDNKATYLVANVIVKNQTGHRFPSGVGFRRAFIELDVTDPKGNVLWASGRTNANGEIVNGTTNDVLPSEKLGSLAYQPHRWKNNPVTAQGQAQIFEELVKNRPLLPTQQPEFTESFIRRDTIVKDNRLLPIGYKHGGPAGVFLPPRWLDATRPKGLGVDCDKYPANCDRGFSDGTGSAVTTYRIALSDIGTSVDPSYLTVSATLWYESWKPAFRAERTHNPGHGPGYAAQRLKVLLDNLQLGNTPLQDWKLQIGQSACADPCHPSPLPSPSP